MITCCIVCVGLAQPTVSRLGRFQVDNIVGCAPFTVNITATNLMPGHDCGGGNTCQMIYEAPPGSQNTFTYVYTTPGTYKLTVVYPSTIGAGNDDITITVLPNVKPDFEIYTCSNDGAVIRITDATYDTYFADFGDGTGSQTVPVSKVLKHTYSSPGNYNIAVHGRKNTPGATDNCDAMVKPFQALAVIPAPFITKLSAIDDQSIQLDFSPMPNIQLKLEIATNSNGAFQALQTLYGVTTTTVSGLKVNDNYYCFRLNSYDACTGTNTPSNIICSQKFAVSAASDVDHLIWSTEGSVVKYAINRGGLPLAATTSKLYDDPFPPCNEQACYQIFADNTDGSTSISLQKCVTPFSDRIPAAIVNTNAIVNAAGTEVSLSWDHDVSFKPVQYSVVRVAVGESIGIVLTSAAPALDDPDYRTAGNFYYRISYKDECNKTSAPGAIVYPIRLGGAPDAANTPHLQWNRYRGWAGEVQNYTIERMDELGNITKTAAVGHDTTFIDGEVDTLHQKLYYKVTADLTGTLLQSVSNVFEINKKPHLYFPTAFTPDQNGMNETFTVRGFFISYLELKIFNRWGTLMFSTTKNEAWDGTFNGKPMPNDTYVWVATIRDRDGQEFKQNGTVLLLTSR